MGLLLPAVLLFFTFGIVLLSTQGLANPLDTPSDVSKIGALQVFDSSNNTLLGLNLGTSDAISSVTLTFDSNIPEDTTVTISLKDTGDVEIGTGSTVTGGPTQTVVISLSDSVTNPERRTLQYASITVA